MSPKNQNMSYEEIEIYRTIQGKREPWFKLKKGDDVLIPSSVPGQPYITRVEAIVTDSDGSNQRVLVRRCYRPEDCVGGRKPFHGAKEVYLSDHFDWQSIDRIEGKCKVHSFDSYTKLESVGNDDFFSRYEYEFNKGEFKQDAVEVYCTCEMPCNPDEFMVQCDECLDWFHPACIGTTIEEAKNFDHFCCQACSEQPAKKKKRVFQSNQ